LIVCRLAKARLCKIEHPGERSTISRSREAPSGGWQLPRPSAGLHALRQPLPIFGKLKPTLLIRGVWCALDFSATFLSVRISRIGRHLASSAFFATYPHNVGQPTKVPEH
jgi:hypothetical protein